MEITELQIIFADRLKGLIDVKYKSVSEFSDAINLPQNSIHNWLYCKRSPQIDVIVKLAKFFDVTADYLLGLEN